MFLVEHLANAFSFYLCWECVGGLVQLRFGAAGDSRSGAATHHEMQLPCLRKVAFSSRRTASEKARKQMKRRIHTTKR